MPVVRVDQCKALAVITGLTDKVYLVCLTGIEIDGNRDLLQIPVSIFDFDHLLMPKKLLYFMFKSYFISSSYCKK